MEQLVPLQVGRENMGALREHNNETTTESIGGASGNNQLPLWCFKMGCHQFAISADGQLAGYHSREPGRGTGGCRGVCG